MRYRADIEGLRGVAVTLVVLCHAGVPLISGGFVGVDVFFVISGFLITSLLVAELTTQSKLDFWSFFARRMRRLMPGFAAMLLGVFLIGSMALPQRMSSAQAESAKWASAWLSNFYFAFAKFSYFGSEARDSAFLHTWSLGVEEQFYVIWPPILSWAWSRWFRYSTSATLRILSIATICGFVAGVAATSWIPIQAYYSMPTRFWELLLGAFGFFLRTSSDKRIAEFRDQTWLCMAGLLAIAASSFFFTERIAYPGIYAAFPTLGAFAILLSGNDTSKNWLTRMLASQPMTFMGRISYSIYLWHWPVLTLGLATAPDTPVRRGALIALSSIVAVLSYFLIERPIRGVPIVNAPRVVLSGFAGSALLILIVQLWSSNASSTQLTLGAHTTSYADRISAQIQFPAIYQMEGCDTWYQSSAVVACRIPAPNTSRGTAVIFGDSVGLQWYDGLVSSFQTKSLDVIVLTKSSCPIVDKSIFYARIKRMYIECDQWRSAAIDYIVALHPQTVVIGSTGSYEFSEAEWRDGTSRILARLKSSVQSLYVIAPTPILPFDGPGCLIASDQSAHGDHFASACSVRLADIEKHDVISALHESAQLEGAKLLYFNDLVCPDGICRALQNGLLVYRDSQHLNAAFVRGVAEKISSRMSAATSN